MKTLGGEKWNKVEIGKQQSFAKQNIRRFDMM